MVWVKSHCEFSEHAQIDGQSDESQSFAHVVTRRRARTCDGTAFLTRAMPVPVLNASGNAEFPGFYQAARPESPLLVRCEAMCSMLCLNCGLAAAAAAALDTSCVPPKLAADAAAGPAYGEALRSWCMLGDGPRCCAAATGGISAFEDICARGAMGPVGLPPFRAIIGQPGR
eukprot:366528-Chlamydomonas_euryale.AAC.2